MLVLKFRYIYLGYLGVGRPFVLDEWFVVEALRVIGKVRVILVVFEELNKIKSPVKVILFLVE